MSGSRDGLARIWDLTTQNLRAELKVGREDNYKTVISQDGKYISTLSGTGTAQIWSSRTGALLAELNANRRNTYQMLMSRNRNLMAVVSHRGPTQIWNLDALR